MQNLSMTNSSKSALNTKITSPAVWRKARLARSVSATDMVAGLLTFVLGACAVRGSMAVAAAAGVATTAVLAERRVLHRFLRHLKWVELRAALTLLIMTAVLLPALPDRPVGDLIDAISAG